MGINQAACNRGRYGDDASNRHLRRLPAAAAVRLLLRGAVFREELVKGFTTTDDRSAQRDGMRFAGERPGTGLASLLIPDAAMSIGIVFAILEQRAICFEPSSTRLATIPIATRARAFAQGTAARSRRNGDIRWASYITGGSAGLHWDRFER